MRQQLQAEGNLSYVQFELLAKLVDAEQPLTMTDLADGVVYSRSGLTHQALRGHVVRALLCDSLSNQDVHILGDMMSRARDHMRARPPRSAAPRKRNPSDVPTAR